jgi:hypothetical protein
MIFLNPLALLGLLAAGIPIVIHFITQRQKRVVDFSSIRLLKELQASSLRTLQIQQWILLALRVCAILLLVSAFARPALRFSFAGLGARSAGSTVIILDNSFSMELSDERGSRFKQAQQVALQILRSLGNGDEASLILLADLQDTRFTQSTRDIGALIQAVENARIGSNEADALSALRIGAGILAQARMVNKEIFFITDAQKNLLPMTTPEDSVKAQAILDDATQLYILPIGLQSSADARNVSIDSLRVVSSLFQANKPIEFEATLNNHGTESIDNLVVNLNMNDERRAQRSMRIEPGQSRVIPISAAPNTTGLVRCAVTIDNDVLPTDNSRHTGIIIPEYRSIAVVGAKNDTEFITLALTADGSADAINSTLNKTMHRIQTIPIAALSASDMQRFDMIICSNITAFSENDIARLQEYCKQGGGLMIIGGDQCNIPSYNAMVFPAFGFGEWSVRKYAAESPTRFSAIDNAHPLLKNLFADNLALTQQTVGTQNLLPESPDILQTLVMAERGIIAVNDGTILAERAYGKGRVLVLGLPTAPTWSTLPVTGIFAAMMFRVPGYMSMTQDNLINTQAGQSFSLRLGSRFSGIQSALLQEPNGATSLRKPIAMPSGAILRFDGFAQTGVYGVLTQQNQPMFAVAINHLAKESVGERLTSGEIRSQFAQYLSPLAT